MGTMRTIGGSVLGGSVAALLLGVVGLADADQTDVSGGWQVNVDCGYVATATSFLGLDEDVTTGEVTTSPPPICGAIEFPNAIQKIDVCSASGAMVGSVGSTSFHLPTSGYTIQDITLAPPYDYVLAGCHVARLLVSTRYDGFVTQSGGIASRIHGTIRNGNFTFYDAGGAVCYTYGGEVPCGFEMYRNDIPVGTAVSATPRPGTTVTFDTVTAPGILAVMPLTTADGSVPPNFQVYGGGAPIPIYYDISTTATVSGPITSCFSYPDGNDDGVVDYTYPWVFEDYLQILHEESGVFVDRTASLDTDANVICAETTSLSQVTLGAEADPPIPWQDHSLARAKVVVRRSAAGNEKIVFVAKDAEFLFPEYGTVNDPQNFQNDGVVLELFAPGEGAHVVFQSDHFNLEWSGDRRKLKSRGASGDLTTVVLVKDRVLKLKTSDAGLALAAEQGMLGVRVTSGLLRNCARFSGDAVFKDLPGRFIGKLSDAAPLADCGDASLGGAGSPGGAFVD